LYYVSQRREWSSIRACGVTSEGRGVALRVASIACEGNDGLCQCESGSGASLGVPFAGWTAVSSGGASCFQGGCESIALVIAKSDRLKAACGLFWSSDRRRWRSEAWWWLCRP